MTYAAMDAQVLWKLVAQCEVAPNCSGAVVCWGADDVAKLIQTIPSACVCECVSKKSELKTLAVIQGLSLIHISEPTRLLSISYAVFCLKKKTKSRARCKTG
eukprot:TRINITY_DN33775_c0_g1_i1.p2 TRINITY_DN33775_c0_g1~~TRINITY_DN33775_c0_g1_i1.p2  ORF type:complete len:102 (-),score=15.28 TRINITY_DN33775_c0_g1_i1:80-385(-)